MTKIIKANEARVRAADVRYEKKKKQEREAAEEFNKLYDLVTQSDVFERVMSHIEFDIQWGRKESIIHGDLSYIMEVSKTEEEEFVYIDEFCEVLSFLGYEVETDDDSRTPLKVIVKWDEE